MQSLRLAAHVSVDNSGNFGIRYYRYLHRIREESGVFAISAKMLASFGSMGYSFVQDVISAGGGFVFTRQKTFP